MFNSLKDLEGRSFGSWRVLTMGDSGGMGAIFQGQHAELGTRVAIKVLLAGAEAKPDAVVRFQNEARIGANLVHPNIARTLDMFRDEQGRIYIVMEWLDGESLSRRLSRGPCSLPEARDMFNGICRALAAAHRANVVHRDIKPANIFLTREHHEIVPKLIDFGIARLAASSSHTRTGLVMGSPPYMSPEQWKGAKNVTVKSDVFGLGVVLYEALAGHNPFDADTLPAVSVKIATTVLPPHPSVPPALHAVLLRATARDPARRIGSADELAAEVAAALDPHCSIVQDPIESTKPALPGYPPTRDTFLREWNEPMPTFSPTVDATTIHGQMPAALPASPEGAPAAPQLQYAPPLLLDEHAVAADQGLSQTAIRQYLSIAGPATLVVALLSWGADLSRGFLDWTGSFDAAVAVLAAVLATALPVAGSVVLWPSPNAPGHTARRAGAILLLLLACWAALIAVGEVWTALQATVSGVAWRRAALRRETFGFALGTGVLWFAGLGFGAIVTWARAASSGSNDSAPEPS